MDRSQFFTASRVARNPMSWPENSLRQRRSGRGVQSDQAVEDEVEDEFEAAGGFRLRRRKNHPVRCDVGQRWQPVSQGAPRAEAEVVVVRLPGLA